jgi:hypothetical protein
MGLQLHRQSSPAQAQQQQQQVPKLRMKQGKHLAQAAALEAQQSGAAAACLALKRRRPLQISSAAVRAATGVLARLSMPSEVAVLCVCVKKPARQDKCCTMHSATSDSGVLPMHAAHQAVLRCPA